MAREIKFRAWDGEMHYGIVPLPDGNVAEFIDSESVAPWQSGSPEVVMQFTGITNNGQEWYEDDILENDGDWYRVSWSDEDARWEAVGIGWTGEIMSLGELVSQETWVQGNAYQNPELISPRPSGDPE